MAAQELTRVYAGWDLEHAEPLGEASRLSLTMEPFGPPAHGMTTYVGPISGTLVVDLTGKQAELLARIVSLRYLAPVPVKPAFRGRRHGW